MPYFCPLFVILFRRYFLSYLISILYVKITFKQELPASLNAKNHHNNNNWTFNFY